MATMIPNDVEEFGTDGERVFFNFLRSVAKPDSRYIAWYLPDIREREPDFLLYCEDVGLVIFEVKDWILNQIEEANPHSFLLDMGGKIESKRGSGRTASSSQENAPGTIDLWILKSELFAVVD